MASKCERNGNGRFVLRDVCSPGGRGGEVSELAFSADGNHILMGTKSFAVRVWGTNSGEVELFAPPLAGSNDDGGYHAGHLSCDVVLSPSRGLIMPAGSATGGVIVWDCMDGGCRTADLRNNGHEYGSCVAHVAAYPDGRYFVSADLTTMKVWSTDDFQCKRTIRNTLEVQILVVSSKSRYIFCAGDSTNPKRGVVTVWSGSGKREETAVGCRGSDAKPVRLLQGHGNSIRSLYAPDDPDVLVTTSVDGRAKVWDVPSGVCTRTVWSTGGTPSTFSYAALVNHGTWLLTSCGDGSLQVWGLETGKCLLTLPGRAAPAAKTPCLRVAVSRCGRLVAFATGCRVQVIDFDKLADRSGAGQPGNPGAYLLHALRFITL